MLASGGAFSLLYIAILNFFVTTYTQEPSNCTNTTVLPNGENVSRCCVFPFVYLGKSRHTCIESGETAWCSTTPNFDHDGQKIPCILKEQGGESEFGEGNCHNFPSGLSKLTGGSRDAVVPWKIQCQSSFAMTSLGDDGNRFRLLGDIKCCNAPVDHNISQVFNLSRKDAGSDDPNLPWNAMCPDSYILTGITIIAIKPKNCWTHTSRYEELAGSFWTIKTHIILYL
ncbi:uncharacterized protein LOC110254769 [Exaiptasia diaphana]|uniref:Fibronectin type-II domain-containing protein n=1 Tax=Exaiptasia diaphana TaxID=2652724 RepID=A0A913YC41_EXADI|nr:uncharacterized protein LOC110254769 [Exaiptasia diaphana]